MKCFRVHGGEIDIYIPSMGGTSIGLDVRRAECQQNLSSWGSDNFDKKNGHLGLPSGRVEGGPRPVPIERQTRESERAPRRSPSCRSLHDSFEIDRISESNIILIFKIYSRKEIPVSQRGEGVGSISRVEVTPSRDRVFSTRILTFDLASRWSKNYEPEIRQLWKAFFVYYQIWPEASSQNIRNLPIRGRTVAGGEGVLGVVVVPWEVMYWFIQDVFF